MSVLRVWIPVLLASSSTGSAEDLPILRRWAGEGAFFHLRVLNDPAARYDLIQDREHWTWFWKAVGLKEPAQAPDFSKETAAVVFFCWADPQTGITVEQVRELQDRVEFRYHAAGGGTSRARRWLMAIVPKTEKRWVFIQSKPDDQDPQRTWGWIERKEAAVRVGADLDQAGSVLILPAPLLDRLELDLARRNAQQSIKLARMFIGSLAAILKFDRDETRLANPRLECTSSLGLGEKAICVVKLENVTSEPLGTGFRCRFDVAFSISGLNYKVQAEVTGRLEEGGRTVLRAEWTGPLSLN